MVTSRLLVVVFYCCFQFTFAQMNGNVNCEYVYGDWTDCKDSSQSRTVECLCDGLSSDLSLCNSTLPVTEKQCQCKWIWSKWSKCSLDCGGGNTTRIPQCFCNNELADDSLCDVNYYFGRETVSCNEYECGEMPALNKLYWISESPEDWPIDNTVFNCSQGEDPKDSPKGMTYYDVLSDPKSSSHIHPEWYVLAKEWITARLNEANGVKFPTDAKTLIVQVGQMLELCSGWSRSEDIAQIYSLKEKLGRLNNNIGGLGNVDAQLNMVLSGMNQDDDEKSRLSLILVIAIPFVAVFIVALALGFVIHYIKKKTAATVEGEPLNLKSMDKPVDNEISLENQEDPVSLTPQREGDSDSDN